MMMIILTIQGLFNSVISSNSETVAQFSACVVLVAEHDMTNKGAVGFVQLIFIMAWSSLFPDFTGNKIRMLVKPWVLLLVSVWVVVENVFEGSHCTFVFSQILLGLGRLASGMLQSCSWKG